MMARWLAALLFAAPLGAAAQQLLPAASGLAFRAEVIESVAARVYRERLTELEAAGLDADRALLQRIDRAAARLRRAAEHQGVGADRLPWEWHVCRRCDENASAMAGGKLLFSEEFLLRLDLSDDELAYLVAHEMAHVLLEHTREFATAGRYFISNGLRREYEDVQAELDQSMGVQLRMAFLSRQQELEADHTGFMLGALAGFDPAAMTSLLHKVDADRGGFGASHPISEQRLRQASEMFDAAQRLWQRAAPMR